MFERFSEHIWIRKYQHYTDRPNIGYIRGEKRALLYDAGGRIALDPDLPERLTIDGEALDPLPGLALMLHKPLGVTCSHKEAGPLVYGLLPERWRRRDPPLSTVGRLDKETSGLLLLTDDGEFANMLMHPKFHISKRYRVTVDSAVSDEAASELSSGVVIDGRMTAPAIINVVSVSPERSVMEMTIREGRNRQIRKMCEAVGLNVKRLKRTAIGPLKLGMLQPGQWRELSKQEVGALRRAATNNK